MTKVFLVRHAKAGSRSAWNGPDRARPLTEKGRRQAKTIAAYLSEYSIDQILTSEYTRCWETVAPLAQERDLLVEEAPALVEGARLSDSLALLAAIGDHSAVLCTHGDVIGDLLSHFDRSGVDLGDDPRLEKGSIWVLSVTDGQVTHAQYVAPPPD